MNGNYLNKLLGVNAKHALYREDGKWYHNLRKFPGVLFDQNGYIRFETQGDYNSHPALQIKRDLHVINGIQSLDSYSEFSLKERSLISPNLLKNASTNLQSEETVRVLREIDLILRKTHLVDILKTLYDNTCQICGTKLNVGLSKFYSEIHHIVSLGKPHNGRDHIENMICVCPNCHILLDFKSIRLFSDSFKIVKHNISNRNIEYHNSLVMI